MSDLPVYKVGIKHERRKRWVDLHEIGARVCVWSMTVAESTQILERAAKPDGKHSTGMVVVLQIMLSCYDGDGADAKSIFQAQDFQPIYDLPLRDMEAIIAAINEVNGKDASEQEVLRDFTAASEERTPSP